MMRPEREQLETIDARVYQFTKQFQDVTNLLTALFERQMDLEEMVKEYYAWVEGSLTFPEEFDTVIEHEVHFKRLHDMQQRAKELLERTVK